MFSLQRAQICDHHHLSCLVLRISSPSTTISHHSWLSLLLSLSLSFFLSFLDSLSFSSHMPLTPSVSPMPRKVKISIWWCILSTSHVYSSTRKNVLLLRDSQANASVRNCCEMHMQITFSRISFCPPPSRHPSRHRCPLLLLQTAPSSFSNTLL